MLAWRRIHREQFELTFLRVADHPLRHGLWANRALAGIGRRSTLNGCEVSASLYEGLDAGHPWTLSKITRSLLQMRFFLLTFAFSWSCFGTLALLARNAASHNREDPQDLQSKPARRQTSRHDLVHRLNSEDGDRLIHRMHLAANCLAQRPGSAAVRRLTTEL